MRPLRPTLDENRRLATPTPRELEVHAPPVTSVTTKVLAPESAQRPVDSAA
jgi:hypothetical protein